MRDPRVEQRLNAHKDIRWEYIPSLLVSLIDRDRSLQNQARVSSEALLPETVKQYTEAVKEGVDFPALVVYEDQPKKYVIIDGNNRNEAYRKANRKTTDAYLVFTDDPAERVSLTFEMNTLNGKDDDASIDNHIITLNSFDVPRPEIARRLGVRPGRVDDAINDWSGFVRAKTLGVHSAWTKIESRFQRVKLNNGLPLDKPFSLAVQYVAKFQPINKRVTEMLAKLRETPAESIQVSYLQELIAQAESTSKKRVHPDGMHGQKVLFGAHLAYIVKADSENAIRGMTASERLETRSRIVQTQEKLAKTLALIDTL